MFLGAYEFDGDPDELLAAYQRLMASYPPEALLLHACTVRADGITVFDACPSEAVFRGFSTGTEFTSAMEAAGLPVPRILHHGEVHLAHLKAPVRP